MENNVPNPPLIAHVILRLGTGGLENGLVNLINNLPEQKFRHAVICMTDYTQFRERIVRKDVEVFCLNKKPGKDFPVYFRLWKLLRKIKPDILHTRNLSALEAQLPGYLAGIKCRIHGEHGRDVEDIDGTNIKYIFLRRFFRLFVQLYVPMSKDLEVWLVNQIKVNPAKICQIYNGVDIDKFKPISSKPLDLLPDNFRNQGLIIIGTVGRQEQVKDPVTLLQAYILWVKQSPQKAVNTRLILVGNGRLNALLHDMARTADIAHQVWFAGDRSDVARLMQTLDIFVLPSINEGISNTILEAMATALPVIATRVGGNPELVADRQTGYLVDRQNPQAMADAIGFYVDHPEIIRQHGEFARKACEERFSLQRMLKDYMQAYELVLMNHG